MIEDRLPGREKGTGYMGGEPVKSKFELLGLAPQIIKKTVLNTGNYGKELFINWSPVLTAFIFIGIIGIFKKIISPKNEPRPYLKLWVFIWILQLLFFTLLLLLIWLIPVYVSFNGPGDNAGSLWSGFGG